MILGSVFQVSCDNPECGKEARLVFLGEADSSDIEHELERRGWEIKYEKVGTNEHGADVVKIKHFCPGGEKQ